MKLEVEENATGAPVIDLAPMIDVVFQLLLFFMLTTTFARRERQLDVDLPAAQTGNRPGAEPDEIVLNVHRDGRIGWGPQTVEAGELDARLRAAAARSPERPVTIRGDRLARHEWIVRVMDACGRASLTNLNVGTLEER